MPVKLEVLRGDTLELLDPRIEQLLQFHFKRIAADCMDRPEDPKARLLTLQFRFVPVYDSQHKECHHVDVNVVGKSKVPDYTTPSFPLAVNKAGFKFNADIPDSLDQSAIPFKE